MKLIQYKSFITLKCITRKGIPHERIRAVAGLGQAKMKQLFEFGEFRFNTVSEFKGFLNNQEFLDNALKFVKAE